MIVEFQHEEADDSRLPLGIAEIDHYASIRLVDRAEGD
jgi:hypothetical protein